MVLAGGAKDLKKKNKNKELDPTKPKTKEMGCGKQNKKFKKLNKMQVTEID